MFPAHLPTFFEVGDISGGTLVVLLSYCTLCDKGKGKKKGEYNNNNFCGPGVGHYGSLDHNFDNFSGSGSTDGAELDKTRFIEYVTICTTIRGLEENT